MRHLALVLVVLCLTASVLGQSGKSKNKIKSPSSSKQSDGKIVNGETVQIQNAPYTVHLTVNSRTSNHKCGGALISPLHVLTVAHCLNKVAPKDVTIRAGSTSSRSGGQVLHVAAIAMHGGYRDSSTHNDIALLKLKSPAQLSATVKTIPLANHKPSPGELFTVHGWGLLQEGSSTSINLQGTVLQTISDAECRKAYLNQAGSLTGGMFCSSGRNAKGITDACQGDSGGPAVSSLTRTLIGLVSWGRGCARANSPGVYTSVAEHRSWIQKAMAQI